MWLRVRHIFMPKLLGKQDEKQKCLVLKVFFQLAPLHIPLPLSHITCSLLTEGISGSWQAADYINWLYISSEGHNIALKLQHSNKIVSPNLMESTFLVTYYNAHWNTSHRVPADSHRIWKPSSACSLQRHLTLAPRGPSLPLCDLRNNSDCAEVWRMRWKSSWSSCLPCSRAWIWSQCCWKD